ncbi:hypothetical protein [Rhodococcus sp. ACT016]|uniref:hypothetical protein n=1 Tax=Rhodococcus sp. ACT016 TaxID=3134808 RepID=UPI003D2A1D11
MIESRLYLDPGDETEPAVVSLRVGEWFYAILDVLEAAAEKGVLLDPEHRRKVEELIVDNPDTDPDELEDFTIALDTIDKRMTGDRHGRN